MPLALAALSAGAYGGVFAFRSLRGDPAPSIDRGHAFDLKIALGFTVAVTVAIFAAAALRDAMGSSGLARRCRGRAVDIQSGAIAVAGLSAAGKMAPSHTVVPILAGLSASTLTKVILAVVTGGRRYALCVAPGLLLVLISAWAGLAVAGLADQPSPGAVAGIPATRDRVATCGEPPTPILIGTSQIHWRTGPDPAVPHHLDPLNSGEDGASARVVAAASFAYVLRAAGHVPVTSDAGARATLRAAESRHLRR